MSTKTRKAAEDAFLEEIRKRCSRGGCHEIGASRCSLCGWNLREEWRRQQRGLVQDADGMWHYVPTKPMQFGQQED